MRTLSIYVVLVTLMAGPATAQILSPGLLAEPHAELEGVRRCTACHELGKRGVQPDRCLACHEALEARIRSDRGYHATVEEGCAECHQEHLGRAFDLLRIDPAAFDHEATGYRLEQSHVDTDCRACHREPNVRDPAVRAFKGEHGALDRTFLGLSSACASCHAPDSPHESQFPERSCASCHDASTWASAPAFDHGATAYPLEGAHRSVDCTACHAKGAGGAAVYRPLAFDSCASCHADPHAGSMGPSCATCHATGAWAALTRANLSGLFDHGRTTFPLRGAHARAECVSCHRTGRAPSSERIRIAYVPGTASHAYPRPRAERCASCHVDRHAFSGASGRWAGCTSCHAEEAWVPADFGIERHDRDATFALEGAHAAVPCVLCHFDGEAGHDRFPLALEGRACRDCHAPDSPHDASYDSMACELCHVVDAFDVVTFDHDAPGVADTAEGCVGCHAAADPHGGQFAGRDCADCHDTDAFTIESFDHSSTGFALDGAHLGAPCAGCHVTEQGPQGGFVRYVPVPSACADCHEETR